MTSWPYYHFSCVIHKLDAEPSTTRYQTIDYWYAHTWFTPSGKYVIRFKRLDQTSDSFVFWKFPEAKIKGNIWEEYPDLTSPKWDEQRVYLHNVICYPSSLSDSDRFLLLGENDDEEMRLLIAPREGRALEIRPLSLSFNEAKRRLEVEWEKRQALKDEETSETGK